MLRIWLVADETEGVNLIGVPAQDLNADRLSDADSLNDAHAEAGVYKVPPLPLEGGGSLSSLFGKNIKLWRG